MATVAGRLLSQPRSFEGFGFVHELPDAEDAASSQVVDPEDDVVFESHPTLMPYSDVPATGKYSIPDRTDLLDLKS